MANLSSKCDVRYWLKFYTNIFRACRIGCHISVFNSRMPLLRGISLSEASSRLIQFDVSITCHYVYPWLWCQNVYLNPLSTNIMVFICFVSRFNHDNYYLQHQTVYVFGRRVCLFVCFVCSFFSPLSIPRLPEVCLVPRSNPLNFGNDADYDLHQGSGLRSFLSAEVCNLWLTVWLEIEMCWFNVKIDKCLVSN